ncbi:hypothetical protein BaRGS_00027208 [Batillaria attramentaria]|uniref:Purinergic receptor n=1 Tax=Batillaria attramentaria TaxID=370345 RepID=A0ABD0K3D1_9CAEN
MALPKVVNSAFGVFFEYDTPRIVHIRSKKVGVINRFLQLVIIGYVIGFAIVYKKGYQEFDNVKGAVTSKLKGVVYTNFSQPGLDGRIWDVGDYVIPPLENSAFFVMTNVLVTPDQTQSTCEEDPTIEDALCETDADCPPGVPIIAGNGVRTGTCVNSTRNETLKVCEIEAWCPVERDDSTSRTPDPALLGSQNFTVFIKNNIEFPKFDVRRRNLPDNVNDAYLSRCHYNPHHDKDRYCPIFTLGTITSEAGHLFDAMAAEVLYYECGLRNIIGFDNDSQLSTCRFNASDPVNKFCPIFILDDIVNLAGHTYDGIATLGGVIQMLITWDCNLDNDVEDCLPEYSFRRLDRGDYKLSRGFNFRYADHYKLGNTSARTLYKAFGIRFVITLQGQAGKFSIFPLFTNIGAGVALLSIATVVCDVIVLYILKARHFYRDNKYLDVKGDDAYEHGVMQDQPLLPILTSFTVCLLCFAVISLWVCTVGALESCALCLGLW